MAGVKDMRKDEVDVREDMERREEAGRACKLELLRARFLPSSRMWLRTAAMFEADLTLAGGAEQVSVSYAVSSSVCHEWPGAAAALSESPVGEASTWRCKREQRARRRVRRL